VAVPGHAVFMPMGLFGPATTNPRGTTFLKGWQGTGGLRHGGENR
jgi:hypothetical protein